MLSRKRLFQTFVCIGLGLAAIVRSNPVEFAPVQAARLEPDGSTQPESLISKPLLLPGRAISLAPPAALTTTVTATEAEAGPVDITVRERPPASRLTSAPMVLTVQLPSRSRL